MAIWNLVSVCACVHLVPLYYILCTTDEDNVDDDDGKRDGKHIHIKESYGFSLFIALNAIYIYGWSWIRFNAVDVDVVGGRANISWIFNLNM